MPDDRALGDKLFDIFMEWAKAQPFIKRVDIAEKLGMEVRCCGNCGCYIGAPYCHSREKANQYACPCPSREIDE